MIITPPAAMITVSDIPQEVLDAFIKAWTEDELGEGGSIAAALNAWPNANKAYFAQGPHLTLPLLKS